MYLLNLIFVYYFSSKSQHNNTILVRLFSIKCRRICWDNSTIFSGNVHFNTVKIRIDGRIFYIFLIPISIKTCNIKLTDCNNKLYQMNYTKDAILTIRFWRSTRKLGKSLKWPIDIASFQMMSFIFVIIRPDISYTFWQYKNLTAKCKKV